MRYRVDLKQSRSVAGVALAGVAALCLSAASPGTAGAQEIGDTLRTANVVLGSQPGNRLVRLKARDPIYRNQEIRTRDASTGEFTFEDSTSLVVGPNARIVLNEAVYGGPQSHQLLSGALRFVTSAASPVTDTVITTPVANIGVRGTIFDVFVEASTGITSILLVAGGPVQACAGAACSIIASVCDAVQVDGGGASAPVPVSEFAGTRANADLFPFAAGAHRMRSIFRRNAARCSLGAGEPWNKASLENRDEDAPEQPEQPDEPVQIEEPEEEETEEVEGSPGETPGTPEGPTGQGPGEGPTGEATGGEFP